MERYQSLLVAGAALAGLAVGLGWPGFSDGAGLLVAPALMALITAIFLRTDIRSITTAPRIKTVIVLSLILNYVITPLLAWGLGATLLADHPDLRIGLLLLLVTPCTDWYLVFTAAARGNTAIATSLLPVNLVLQGALLPVYVLLLGGDAEAINPWQLIYALVMVILIPAALATGIRLMLRAGQLRRYRQRVHQAAGHSMVPLLCAAVAAMFVWQAPTAVAHAQHLVWLALPLLMFFLAAPLLALVASHITGLGRPERTTLIMVTVARNSPIALGVAILAFPGQPLVAVALVIAPLVELPYLMLLSHLLRRSGGDSERQRLGK